MSACARCGAAFRCEAVDGAENLAPCWCMRQPPLSETALTELRRRYDGCLCPSCLSEIAPAAQRGNQD